MTEDRAAYLTELIDNRISHRKAEEKYFYDKYEKQHPWNERKGSCMEYVKTMKVAFTAHMEEYEKRIAAK